MQASTHTTREAESLAEVGFTQTGAGRYQREDVELVTGRWLAFTCPASSAVAGLAGPGLWKLADATGATQVFDFPVGELQLASADGGEDLENLIEWMWVTRTGALPTAEASPANGVLADGEPTASELTVRTGPFTCQGEMHVDGDRRFVDFRLATPTGELSDCRKSWLEETLAATTRFRMVRVGLDPEHGSVHARVDLSGAPPVLADALLETAVAHARAVATELLPAITFLTNANVVSRALELGAFARQDDNEGK